MAATKKSKKFPARFHMYLKQRLDPGYGNVFFIRDPNEKRVHGSEKKLVLPHQAASDLSHQQVLQDCGRIDVIETSIV